MPNSFDKFGRLSLNTGQVGRPQLTLPEGVKVRLKNKGSQSHKTGPKRPKYQTPKREHPDTSQDLDDNDIHANHLEAFNSAIRRKLSGFRRRTNRYAKTLATLQTRLDVHWIIHNFIRFHFTTKQVPAIAIGVLDQVLSFADLFKIRYV